MALLREHRGRDLSSPPIARGIRGHQAAQSIRMMRVLVAARGMRVHLRLVVDGNSRTLGKGEKETAARMMSSH